MKKAAIVLAFSAPAAAFQPSFSPLGAVQTGPMIRTGPSISMFSSAGKKAAPAKVAPAKKAPVKKAAAKAPAKKVVAKKAPAKKVVAKVVAKKAPVKKAPVKKAPVKKAAPSRSSAKGSSQKYGSAISINSINSGLSLQDLAASQKSTGPAFGLTADTIGVTPPLGVWDPLGLIETRDMRRYEIMEIKHGRAAMLGFLGVITTESGIRLSDKTYLSPSNDLKFADMPGGALASWAALPLGGWLQIMITTCMMETGYFLWNPQTDDKAPGDIAPEGWVRYADEETKTFKLNVERNNGRAAMLGMFGVLSHELLGVDGLYPTGGMSGAAPPTIF